MAKSLQPDALAVGTLCVVVSHAEGLPAARAFLKLRVGKQRQASEPVKATANEHRFTSSLQFRGTFGELARAPMVVSAWEAHPEGQIGLLGEGRIDVGALVSEMQGIQCGVLIGQGQVLLAAHWTPEFEPVGPSSLGTLRVRLLSGLEIEPLGPTDAGDPFVTLSVGGEQRQSKPAPATVHPRWDELFVLRGTFGSLTAAPLVIGVFDASAANARLGAGSVDLNELLRTMNGTACGVPLTSEESVARGRVCLSALWTSDGTSAPAASEVGTLRVHVGQGNALSPPPAWASGTALVELMVGKSLQTSRAVAMSSAPSWSENLEFSGRFGELTAQPMLVGVFDRPNVDRACFLGEGRVDLGLLLRTLQGAVVAVALEAGGAQAGQVLLSAEWERQAQQPPPDAWQVGTLHIELSHGTGLKSNDVCIRLRVGSEEQTSSLLRRTAAAKWYEDFAFAGVVYGDVMARPLALSVCNAANEQVAASRVDVGLLMETMQGRMCAVEMSEGEGQVLLAAWWEPDYEATLARAAALREQARRKAEEAAAARKAADGWAAEMLLVAAEKAEKAAVEQAAAERALAAKVAADKAAAERLLAEKTAFEDAAAAFYEAEREACAKSAAKEAVMEGARRIMAEAAAVAAAEAAAHEEAEARREEARRAAEEQAREQREEEEEMARARLAEAAFALAEAAGVRQAAEEVETEQAARLAAAAEAQREVDREAALATATEKAAARAAALAEAEVAAVAPPDEISMGTLRLHASHGTNFSAARAFIKLTVNGTRQVGEPVEKTAASEHRWAADFSFRGVYNTLAGAPLTVSVWESRSDGRVGLLATALVGLSTLIPVQQGTLVEIAAGQGQVLLAAHWTPEFEPVGPSSLGTLRVRLLSGLEIEPLGPTDAGDPFVTLSVGGEQRQSKPAPATVHPRWDELFVFRGTFGSLTAAPLVIGVFDASAANARLGAGSVDLNELLRTMNGTACGVPLTSEESVARGRVCLSALWTSDGTSAPAASEVGTLRVHVGQGNALSPPPASTGEALVHLTIGKSLQTSRAVAMSSAPSWSENLEFSGRFGELTAQPMLVGVFDRPNVDRACFLGEGRVDLGLLLRTLQGAVVAVALEAGGAQAGQVLLSAEWERQAQQPPPDAWQVGTLHIELSHGTGLKSMDGSGLCEPYAQLLVGIHERRSKTLIKTAEPTWLEQYTFVGGYGEFSAQPLVFDVSDSTRGYMGEGRVDLSLLLAQHGKLCALDLSDGQDTPGQLLVGARWEPGLSAVAVAALGAAEEQDWTLQGEEGDDSSSDESSNAGRSESSRRLSRSVRERRGTLTEGSIRLMSSSRRSRVGESGATLSEGSNLDRPSTCADVEASNAHSDGAGHRGSPSDGRRASYCDGTSFPNRRGTAALVVVNASDFSDEKPTRGRSRSKIMRKTSFTPAEGSEARTSASGGQSDSRDEGSSLPSNTPSIRQKSASRRASAEATATKSAAQPRSATPPSTRRSCGAAARRASHSDESEGSPHCSTRSTSCRQTTTVELSANGTAGEGSTTAVRRRDTLSEGSIRMMAAFSGRGSLLSDEPICLSGCFDEGGVQSSGAKSSDVLDMAAVEMAREATAAQLSRGLAAYEAILENEPALAKLQQYRGAVNIGDWSASRRAIVAAAAASVISTRRQQSERAYAHGRKMSRTGKLLVHLSHATGLLAPAREAGRLYVTLAMGSLVSSSRLVSAAHDPRWAEDFEFRGRLRVLLSSPLQIRCWGWDFVADDQALGHGAYSLHLHEHALSDGGPLINFVLELQEGTARAGQLFLTVRWQPYEFDEGRTFLQSSLLGALYSKYPTPVQRADAPSAPPAVASERSLELLMWLETRPDAAAEVINDELWLHRALRKPAHESEVVVLLHSYGEGASMADRTGILPLHLALHFGASDLIVERLLLLHPDAAKRADASDNMPLHLALRNRVGERVLKAIFAAHPDACKTTNAEGNLPLHLAISTKRAENAVLAFLHAWPEAAMSPNRGGTLPLHATLKQRAAERVVSAVLAACPEAATEEDAKGDLPLHIVLRMGREPSLVLSVLSAAPEAAKRRSRDRCLPIHLALSHGAAAEVVIRLVDAFTDSALEDDKEGVLPLERAIANKCGADVIRTLFLANPFAATYIRNPMACTPSVLELIEPFLVSPSFFGTPLELDTQQMAGFLDRCPKAFDIEPEALAACQEYLVSAQHEQTQAEGGWSCSFDLLVAAKIRDAKITRLPSRRVIRTDPAYSGWHEARVVSFGQACRGAYRHDCLAVSHRWESEDEPDPDGEQLLGLQSHLQAHPEVRYVFVDFACSPLRPHASWESRSGQAQREGGLLLANMLTVFLGFSVLLLVDDVSPCRFWCQLETWLALQTPTAAGLRPTPTDELRAHFMFYASATDEQQAQACRAQPAAVLLFADFADLSHGRAPQLDQRLCSSLAAVAHFDLRPCVSALLLTRCSLPPLCYLPP